MTPEAPSDPTPSMLRLEHGPLAYTDVGEGEVIIAVHGLPGSVRDFRWLGAAIEPRARFIRLDLPASGKTPLATMPSPRIRDRAELMVRLLDALGIERATVLGHSMGGSVALTAAADWPDRFRGVALLASEGLRPHRGERRGPNPAVVARLLAAPVLGSALLPVFRRLIRAFGFRGRYSDEELIHLNACAAAVSHDEIRATVRRLTAPTLMAWAEDDPIVEPAISRELSDAVPLGPRLSWANGGHNIQKTRAVEIADALLEWLPSTDRV